MVVVLSAMLIMRCAFAGTMTVVFLDDWIILEGDRDPERTAIILAAWSSDLTGVEFLVMRWVHQILSTHADSDVIVGSSRKAITIVKATVGVLLTVSSVIPVRMSVQVVTIVAVEVTDLSSRVALLKIRVKADRVPPDRIFAPEVHHDRVVLWILSGSKDVQ